MKMTIKKILSVTRFSIVLILLTPIVDILFYIIKENSIKDGLDSLFYDAMLNCSTSFFAPITVILIVISTISSAIFHLLKEDEDF